MSGNPSTPAPWGAFSEDGREYAIFRPDLPRPWAHYITNAHYGAWLTQTFDGASTYPLREGTVLNRPAIADRFGRCVWVRDRDSGKLWSINWEPMRGGPTRFKCRHGLGYSIIESENEGIDGRVRFFVDRNDPAEFWTVTLANPGPQARNLQFFILLEWSLGNSMAAHDKPCWYTHVLFDALRNALIATVDEAAHPGRFQRAFMKSWAKVDGYTASRSALLGNGTWDHPALVAAGRSDNRPADGEEAVACLQFDLELPPGGSRQIDLAVGMDHHGDQALGTLAALEGGGDVQSRFSRIRDYWDDLTGRLRIHTPEPSFDRWINGWMSYQLVQCCRWSGGNGANSPRSGFRDLLQVCMGMVHLDPKAARAKMLEAMAHQYSSGRAVRAWSVRGDHDTRDYRDSPVWIVFALDSYLRHTGDRDLLDQQTPFLDGGRASVLEHAHRAVEALWNDRGEHGLSHIGEGDWLDPLNRAGVGGRGESVWLSMALHLALLQMARLRRSLGQDEEARILQERAGRLKQAINKHGWDGQWYLQALDDQGAAIGSHRSAEASCFLLPQVWAVFSEVADETRATQAMEAVRRRLRLPYGYLLFAPDYRAHQHNVGGLSILRMKRIVYSHANLFKIWADCHLGRGDEAFETFRMIDPANPDHPPEQSLAEPYILPNGYCDAEFADRGGRVMYSGFSGAMPWTIKYAVEGLFGIKADEDALAIDPCIPSAWPECQITLYLRQARYHVRICNPSKVCRGVAHLSVNGKIMEGNRLAYAAPGTICRIECRLGESSTRL